MRSIFVSHSMAATNAVGNVLKPGTAMGLRKDHYLLLLLVLVLSARWTVPPLAAACLLGAKRRLQAGEWMKERSTCCFQRLITTFVESRGSAGCLCCICLLTAGTSGSIYFWLSLLYIVTSLLMIEWHQTYRAHWAIRRSGCPLGCPGYRLMTSFPFETIAAMWALWRGVEGVLHKPYCYVRYGITIRTAMQFDVAMMSCMHGCVSTHPLVSDSGRSYRMSEKVVTSQFNLA